MAIKRFEFGGIDMVASLYTVPLLVIVGFKHPAFLAEKAEELPCQSARAGCEPDSWQGRCLVLFGCLR